MAKPGNAISSIITVVIFLALTAVATVLYSGNAEQKVKMEQNFFGRNAKLAMDYTWIALQGITDISLGKKYEKPGQASSATEIETTDEDGFFKKIVTAIRKEWEKNNRERKTVLPFKFLSR